MRVEITMEKTSMTCEAYIENLDRVLGFVEECAERFGLSDKRKIDLMLAVEEAFVNVCHYAYTGREGDVEFVCFGEGDSFVVEIADKGVAFNVLTLPDPDTSADVMERKIGGLGVFFIRKMTDDLSYRREDGRNILRMVLRSHNSDKKS